MQTSEVVAHCVQIINDFFAIALQNIVAHIQRFNWEVNFILKLFAAKQGVSGVTEAFEVDDQALRDFEDFHFLGGDHLVFAFATVPLIISGKRLFNHEVVQAVIQRDLRVRRRMNDLIFIFVH